MLPSNFSDSQIILHTSKNLSHLEHYYIKMLSGVVKDTSEKDFKGFDNPSTTTFAPLGPLDKDAPLHLSPFKITEVSLSINLR